MNDGIKEIGKYMKETGSKTAHALDRHRKNIPIVQRLRDVFDSTQSFDAKFDTTPTDRVKMTLYFTPGLPALIGNQNNCGDCYCYNRDDFVGGSSEYTTTYTPVSGLRVYINNIRTTNISLVGSVVTVNDTTTSVDIVSIRYVYKYVGNCGSGSGGDDGNDDCADTGDEIGYFTHYVLRYAVGSNLGEYLDESLDLQPVVEGYSLAPQGYRPGGGKAQGDLEDDVPPEATTAPYSYKEYRSIVVYALDNYGLGTARATGTVTVQAYDPNDPTPQDTSGAQYTYRISTTAWDARTDPALGWTPTGPTIAEGTISVPLTNTVYEAPFDVQFNYDGTANAQIQLHIQLVDATYGVISTGGAAFQQSFVEGDTSSPGSPYAGPQVLLRFALTSEDHQPAPIVYAQTCSCQPDSNLGGDKWNLFYRNGSNPPIGYFVSGPESPNQTKARVGREQFSDPGDGGPPFMFQEVRQIIEYELPTGTTHVRLTGKILDDATGFNQPNPPAGPGTPPGYATHYKIATTEWEDHGDPLSDGGWEPNGVVLFEGDIPVPEVALRDNGVNFDVTLPVGVDQEVFSIHLSSTNPTGLTLISQDDYLTTFAIDAFTFVDGDATAPATSIGEWDGAASGVYVATQNSRVGDEQSAWPPLIAFVGCNGDTPEPEPTPDPTPPDPDDPGDDSGGSGGGAGGGGGGGYGGGGGGGGPSGGGGIGEIPGDLPAVTHTFNGDCTGNTDVYSSLQSFINALPTNGAVWGFGCPGGIYNIGNHGKLLVQGKTNLTIVGNLSQLRRSGINNTVGIMSFQNSCENIRIDSLKLRGTNPQPGHWELDYEHEHGIEISGVRGFNANNLTIENIGGDFIYFTASDNRWSDTVRIHHSYFYGNGRMGIAFTDGIRNCTIDYNVFENIGYYTWDVEPNGLLEEGILAGAVNVLIADNRIVGRPYGQFISGSSDPLIQEQAFGYMFAITGTSGPGPGTQITLTRNIIEDGAMRTGVFDNGGAREDFVFTNNTSNASFHVTPDIGVVVTVQGTTNVQITGNVQDITTGTFENHSGSDGVINVTSPPNIIT